MTETIETFDTDGSAVEVPESVWQDWRYAVTNNSTHQGLLDYYREEYEA